jgi:hypothetical protein
MSIKLSGPQFLAIANAGAALCPLDRDQFFAAVASELQGRPIGDGSVGCAIRAAQAAFPRPEPEQRRTPSRWDRDAPSFERTSKRAY